MRPFVSGLVAVLAVSACQAKLTGNVIVVDKPASARPSAAASAAASAAPQGSPLPAASQLLVKPTGPTRVVTGTLKLDAGYMVARGNGRIISSDGASVLAAGNIISSDGASIISGGAGNIIASDGASILANDGASIISNDSASIIGQGPLPSVISGGAGNALGTAGKSFRLFAAGDVTGGAVLPVKGMLLGVLSMITGKPIPLGQGPNGPVNLIFTNASGEFTLYLPESVVDNVRLITQVWGLSDARLTHNLVTSPVEAESRAIDDDTALATTYLRLALVRSLTDLTESEANSPGASGDNVNVPDIIKPQVQAMLARLRQALATANVAGKSPEVRAARIQRIADLICGKAILDDLTIFDPKEESGLNPETPALAQLALEFKEVRERATLKLASGETPKPAAGNYFTNKPYFIAANRARQKAGLPLYQIEHGPDLVDFLVKEYLSLNDDGELERALVLLTDLGFEEKKLARVRASAGGIYQGLFHQLVQEPAAGTPSVLDQVVAVIEDSAVTTGTP